MIKTILRHEVAVIINTSINRILSEHNIYLKSKPIVFGDNALFFHGIEKKMGFSEVIVSLDDFNMLKNQDNNTKKLVLKDLWGDLGIELPSMDIWRSFSLFDYEFFLQDTIECENAHIISLDKLLFTKVLKMDKKRHYEDLIKLKEHYHSSFRNEEYVLHALANYSLYNDNSDGVIYLTK